MGEKNGKCQLWIEDVVFEKMSQIHFWDVYNTWYHRTSNSSPGFLKNPPTSAPTNGIPATLKLNSIGNAIFRCDQSAVLSPVQTEARNK
uniref:Uncharacterized protein n=1 Tax=Romanomermis culicivorax TaxID=13658 RepID=A0A915J0V1_ROMCU